jgi:hypothetical protein
MRVRPITQYFTQHLMQQRVGQWTMDNGDADDSITGNSKTPTPSFTVGEGRGARAQARQQLARPLRHHIMHRRLLVELDLLTTRHARVLALASN